MNYSNQSNTQQQSEILPSENSFKQITPLGKLPSYEPIFHSSQIKRPTIKFVDINKNIFENDNNSNDLNQSFNYINTYKLSKITENTILSKNKNINPNNLNLFNINKSVQQEKYDLIKNYCSTKNDPDSYPLISYENFLLIDGLREKNTPEYEPYKNFLLNKNASIELYSKFCTLLMNRYILSKQNKSINKYPKIVYQIIFDVNNIYNFLAPDIVADAKQSNIFIALVNYENMWNVLAINQNNNYCNYFMLNKNMDKDIILSLMNTIKNVIYPYHSFKYSVSDYSGFNDNNKIILPFIILDFFSRNKTLLPIDDEDYYYQTILILSEIMTSNLITK